MKIRSIQKEDVKRIVEIYAQTDAYDAEKIKKFYSDFYKTPNRKKTIRDFVIVDNDKIIGFSGFAKETTGTEDVYWLNWTAIDQEYQRKGVGKFILDHIFDRLRKLDCRKLYVITTTENKYKPAVKFYKSLGFKIEGKLQDYYRKGVDSVMLGIEL